MASSLDASSQFTSYTLIYYFSSFLFEERLWAILTKHGFVNVVRKSRLLR